MKGEWGSVTLFRYRSIIVVTLRSEDGLVVAGTAGEAEVAASVEHVEIYTGRESE